MRHKLCLYLLLLSLLNGAFFNRIGSRVAERSYLATICFLFLSNLGIAEHPAQTIKVTKKNTPTNNSGQSNFALKQLPAFDKDHHFYKPLLVCSVSLEIFSYSYIDDISEAHLPPIFKPPA